MMHDGDIRGAEVARVSIEARAVTGIGDNHGVGGTPDRQISAIKDVVVSVPQIAVGINVTHDDDVGASRRCLLLALGRS